MGVLKKMRKQIQFVTLKQITEFLQDIQVDFEIYGNKESCILGFSSFDRYKEGTITWIKDIQNYHKRNTDQINPALIVIDREVNKVSNYTNKLVCDNPKYIFFLILSEFFEEKPKSGIEEGSYISEKAILNKGISIGAGCIIEDNVIVGNGTKVYHNVVIRKGTIIGENCIIKSGTVIGEEGYGYSVDNGKMVHVPHLGNVIIEDEVEIGSNCSIDRGTMENTIIGKGSKIDNLCHIAHNVQIDKNVMIVAGAIICGSVHIESGAYIAPGAIIKNQIEIGERCVIGMGSVVLNNTDSGKVVAGVPAKNLH